MPRIGKFVDSWRAMIRLRDDGLIRSIGVCNFTEEHLTTIINETGVVPAVNQIELHPHFPQSAMRAFHAEHGIQTESWSPLARQRDAVDNPVILGVAEAHGVTPAQAVLRWHVQLGSISALESGRLWGGDPNTNEEF